MPLFDRIEEYKKLINEGDAIAVIWQDEDVVIQAANNNIVLTQQEVRDILSLMDSNHDATLGISWDTIDHYISWAIRERK